MRITAGEQVHVVPGQVPADYHCRCEYCTASIGELLRPEPWAADPKTGKVDKSKYYSRNDRRGYYDPIERVKLDPNGEKIAHIAKTPLHIARWAIQQFTEPGDWVLDPTIGAGTTAVEAITQGRSVAGMEIQYSQVLEANVKKAKEYWRSDAKSLQVGAMTRVPEACIRIGDARQIGEYLDMLREEGGTEFSLVVNNPPYSGDESMPSPAKEGRGPEHRDKEVTFKYRDGLPNLAFLKEGPEYWDAIEFIYESCARHLKPGGKFVVGVKDMIKQRQPYLLHRQYANAMANVGLKFVGTAFLRHYPGTLFLNSYEKMHGAKPPLYQTIVVFEKPGD